MILITIQLYYWYYIYWGIAKYQSKGTTNTLNQPVSVIICARNEEKNLNNSLPYVLKQTYPEFQTLIIDDDSVDKTASLIKRMQKKERYLTYHKVIKKKDGKKEALVSGIVKSRHSWLLLTDADCRPNSNYWIKKMTDSIQNQNIKVVLGYSPYTNNGSFIQHWIHFEGWITGVQYLSYALKGMPYMGVGRNILYHKSLITPDIILNHNDLSSGDDDLTVNEIATPDNTNICISKDSFVETAPSTTWSAYFRQKRRHFSTAHRYKLPQSFLLALYSISLILMFFSLSFLLFLKAFYIALILYLIRLILIIPIAKQLMEKLNASFKLWMFPFLDLGQCFFYILFSFAVLLPKKNSW